MNPTTLNPGDVIPAGVLDKAKLYASMISGIVALITTGAVYALVPTDWQPRVLAIGAAVTGICSWVGTWAKSAKTETPMTINDPPGRHEAPEPNNPVNPGV